MRTATVQNRCLQGTVRVPSSKSHIHRLLLLSLLSGNQITVFGELNGEDTKATLRFLYALGVDGKPIDGGIVLTPPRVYNDNIGVEVGESGSTLRFAVPICSALGINASFYGKGRLGERPLNGLKDCLGKVGVTVRDGTFPITVSGKIDNPSLALDASESSQYLTGALYAVCLLGGGEIRVTGGNGSAGYVDMTIDVLTEFGFEIERTGNLYVVKKGDRGQRTFVAEGDWSSACFWIASGAVNGDIVVRGLKYPSRQPDSEIVRILRDVGADIEISVDELRVRKSHLEPVVFDADGCPDLVPAIAVALSATKGVSVVRGIKRLRIKESDRVQAVTDMLTAFGVNAVAEEDLLIVYGSGALTGGSIATHGDHRIAMAGAVGGAVASGVTRIDDRDCVKKSYPNFWQDYVLLGGKVNE